MSISTDRLAAWVLVAGTGRRDRVHRNVTYVAQELGFALADQGCGLVTGGWHGVDQIVTTAFVDRCTSLSIDPNRRLVQVIRSGFDIHVQLGQIVRVPVGVEEWLGAQTYADAVVILGGYGGAYKTFLGALHGGLPRFPLRDTGGDAEKAYEQMVSLWELIPNAGISLEQFREIGVRIKDVDAAKATAVKATELLVTSVRETREDRKPPPCVTEVFIASVGEDHDWAKRLRSVLHPLERQEMLRSWTDDDISPGQDRPTEIAAKAERCQVAVLFVSATFLSSDDPLATSMTRMLERAGRNGLELLWVLAGPCLWEATPLSGLKAVLDPVQSLVQMNQAQAQVAIVDIAREIMKAVQRSRAA